MLSTTRANSLERLLERLEPDQRKMLAEAPREDRLPLLASFRHETEAVTLQLLGEATGCPVLEKFELLPQATDHIPLRLIHAFQCLPIAIQIPQHQFETVAPVGAAIELAVMAAAGKYANAPGRIPQDRVRPAGQMNAEPLVRHRVTGLEAAVSHGAPGHTGTIGQPAHQIGGVQAFLAYLHPEVFTASGQRMVHLFVHAKVGGLTADHRADFRSAL